MFYPLLSIDQLAPGTARLVIVDEAWIGLFHTQKGIFAVDARCPHAGANLVKGSVCDETVSCPVHLWRFRLADGNFLDADQPQYNLRTYTVRRDADWIEVDLDQKPRAVRVI